MRCIWAMRAALTWETPITMPSRSTDDLRVEGQISNRLIVARRDLVNCAERIELVFGAFGGTLSSNACK